MKKFWSFVKSTRSQPENLSFNINNQQCTDPAKIAQEFNDLFARFFFFFAHNDHTVEITSPELKVQNICIMSVLVLTWFLTELKKIGADKAVGPDNISGRMLKMCADSIAPISARIFDISIASGCPWNGKLPMLSLFTKKGDRSTLTN